MCVRRAVLLKRAIANPGSPRAGECAIGHKIANDDILAAAFFRSLLALDAAASLPAQPFFARTSPACWRRALCRHFEEIPPPPAASPGSHNGRLADMYLPETTGAGCGFLDYDNDGWMDIYLVNSGACDFYNLRNAVAQRSLPQQSRRHVYRRHRESRRAPEAATAWASPSAITTATASPTSM